MLPRALVLAMLALPGIPAAAADPAAFAPLAAAALPLGDEVAVSWAPGIQPVDSFRVYGLAGGDVKLLLDTVGTADPLTAAAVVESGWTTYAVAGVRDGVESDWVHAAGSLEVVCVTVSFHPPSVSRRCL